MCVVCAVWVVCGRRVLSCSSRYHRWYFRDCSFRASTRAVETPPPSTLIIPNCVLPYLAGHTLLIVTATAQSHIKSYLQYTLNISSISQFSILIASSLSQASLGLPFCASTPPKATEARPLPIPWPTTGALPKADPQKQGSTINDLCTTPNVHTRTTSRTRSSSLSTSTSHLPPLSLSFRRSSPLPLVVLFPWGEIGRLPFATPGSPGCKGSRRDSVGAFLYNCELSPPPKPPALPSASEPPPTSCAASAPLAARPSRTAPLSLNPKLTPFPRPVL